MNMNVWVDPRVANVRLAALESYLLKHGWKRVPHPRRQLMVFEGPLDDDDGEPFLITFPSSESFKDFRADVIQAITALSVLEDRHPVEILNDMLKENPQPIPRSATQDGANGPARPSKRRP